MMLPQKHITGCASASKGVLPIHHKTPSAEAGPPQVDLAQVASFLLKKDIVMDSIILVNEEV